MRVKKIEGNRLQVLLIESNADWESGLALASYLKRNGCNVDQVDTGWHAWQVMCRLRYDVVLTDLRLSDISGLELLRIMRTLSNAPPAILGMHHFSMPIEKIALNMGASRCYAKPLPAEKVYELMIDVIERGDHGDADEQLAA